VTLHRRIVRFFNLEADSGVMVAGIEPNSPAGQAGLQEGDVIVAFDGGEITGIDDLHRNLTGERVGQATPLTVIRRTEKLDLKITPAESRPRE
jgi:S1-C subfamily serine protease